MEPAAGCDSEKSAGDKQKKNYRNGCFLSHHSIGGSTISPTFAKIVTSFIEKFHFDSGVEQAVNNGFSNRIDTQVSDKGVTLHIEEVLADPTRIVMSYYTERGNGNRSVDYLQGKLYITDDKGNILARSPNRFQRDDQYGYYQFDLPSTTDQLFIHLNIPRIASISYPDVEGKWDIVIPVDMKKSISNTTSIPI